MRNSCATHSCIYTNWSSCDFLRPFPLRPAVRTPQLPQIIHIHTTVVNSGRAHTTQHRTHCGLWLWPLSWLMPQSPHRLQNDIKCVEWDVNLAQSNTQGRRARGDPRTRFKWCGARLWTVGFSYRWRGMEAAAQNKAGWRQVICWPCFTASDKAQVKSE